MLERTKLFAALFCAAVIMLTPLAADARGHHRKDGPPPPTQEVVLEVCHPKTGCPLQVPVCIPVCCQGAPCVRHQATLIGHGKTTFTWACGHEVTIRFTHGGGYRVLQ